MLRRSLVGIVLLVLCCLFVRAVPSFRLVPFYLGDVWHYLGVPGIQGLGFSVYDWALIACLRELEMGGRREDRTLDRDAVM